MYPDIFITGLAAGYGVTQLMRSQRNMTIAYVLGVLPASTAQMGFGFAVAHDFDGSAPMGTGNEARGRRTSEVQLRQRRVAHQRIGDVLDPIRIDAAKYIKNHPPNEHDEKMNTKSIRRTTATHS